MKPELLHGALAHTRTHIVQRILYGAKLAFVRQHVKCVVLLARKHGYRLKLLVEFHRSGSRGVSLHHMFVVAKLDIGESPPGPGHVEPARRRNACHQ